jgi:hypothetical protein
MSPPGIESIMEKGQVPEPASPMSTATTNTEGYEVSCQKPSSFPSIYSGLFADSFLCLQIIDMNLAELPV